ncbi:rhodanese-like domain-containing protein [Pedobacter sp.]
MRNLYLLLIGLLLSFSAYSQKKISAAKLDRKLKKDIQLVDVRTEKEYKEKHIADAVNVDVEKPNFEDAAQTLDKNQPVYVYCRTGKRSSKAAHKLKSLGFTKVYDLKGGITSWNNRQEKKK